MFDYEAFGSGEHATTALCANWLEQQAWPFSRLSKTIIFFGVFCRSRISKLSGMVVSGVRPYVWKLLKHHVAFSHEFAVLIRLWQNKLRRNRCLMVHFVSKLIFFLVCRTKISLRIRSVVLFDFIFLICLLCVCHVLFKFRSAVKLSSQIKSGIWAKTGAKVIIFQQEEICL